MFLTKGFSAKSPGPADDFWYGPVGSHSMAGFNITEDQAIRMSAVFACVRVLAETVAQTPIPLYRRTDGDGKERAKNHPLYNLIAHRPNRHQTSFEWREMMQAHLGLRGNALNRKVYNGRGDLVELSPLDPDRVQYKDVDGELRYHYSDKKTGRTEVLLPEEVLHIKFLTRDGRVGMNPLEAARESVGLGLAAQEYGSTFYKNGAQMPGWIEFEGKFDTAEARNKFRESWQEAQVGKNRFKTPVLDAGFKYHELGLKHSDAQFLETRKYQDNDIARIFRIQPHMIGILDRSTFSNIEQQSLEFVVHTMGPWFVRWEQALSNALLDEDERGEYFFEFLVDGLLRGDIKTRYDAYGKGIEYGFLTRNEARQRENLDPLPGLDEPLEPLNMARSSDRAGSGETQALAEASAQRVVNKEVKALRNIRDRAGDDTEFRAQAVDFFRQHAEYVETQMACSASMALQYCLTSARDIEQEQNIDSLLFEWEATKAARLAEMRVNE